MTDNMNDLGKMLKQRRLTVGLTLHQLSVNSRVSASHLGRIERGERFPSAQTLRRIAKPLGLDDGELFTLAGFLSPTPTEDTRGKSSETVPRLDPYVARVLAEEPLEVQHSVVTLLVILKSLTKNVVRENLQYYWEIYRQLLLVMLPRHATLRIIQRSP